MSSVFLICQWAYRKCFQVSFQPYTNLSVTEVLQVQSAEDDRDSLCHPTESNVNRTIYMTLRLDFIFCFLHVAAENRGICFSPGI